jgi:hypothetical protein
VTISNSRPSKLKAMSLCAALVVALSVGGVMVSSSRAGAVTGYHVVVGSLGLNARSGPGTGYAVVGHLVNGQPIDIACQTKGTLVGVGLPGTPTDVWDQLTNGWFITDYYTSTPGLGGSYTPGIPQCASTPTPAPPTTIYRRGLAAAWAMATVNSANGSHFFSNDPGDDGKDCTYFVSSALWVGGLPKTADWTNNSWDWNKLASHGWIPGPTINAAYADAFKNYVVNSRIATIKEVRWSDNTAGGAQLGDVIGYDWDNGADGRLDHLAIVTSLNSQGYPSVTQHSPSRTRFWSWDPRKGNWIEFAHPGARVYLLHIIKEVRQFR